MSVFGQAWETYRAEFQAESVTPITTIPHPFSGVPTDLVNWT